MIISAEQKLADSYLQTLYTLSREVRQYVAKKLTDSLSHEEAGSDNSHIKRRAKVVRHAENGVLSDAEMERRFSGKAMPNYPDEEPTWSEVINANTKKTIKPVEKWL